ncbi:hypothetical protein SDC9_122400 [bioreactor metagenome]|uniref:Uncharacterized protein n=1 Tax=bioreactor metagenome TaxID=1076179 RepID=A0A645CEM2_9ZZZZ
MCLCVQFRVEYHLGHSGLVPEFDKNDASKVTATAKPTVEGHFFP